MFARVMCAECGEKDEWRINSSIPPPEALPRHFANQGWQTVKKPVCPECILKKRKTKVANITPIKPEVEAPEQSEAAKKVKRMIYQALEDYFDDTKGCYRDGKNDATVAKELGTSEKFVKAIREADFGTLKEPQELAELRGQISAAMSDLGKMQARLDLIARREGWN